MSFSWVWYLHNATVSNVSMNGTYCASILRSFYQFVEESRLFSDFSAISTVRPSHVVSHAVRKLPTVEAPVLYATEVPPTRQSPQLYTYVWSSPANSFPLCHSIHKYSTSRLWSLIIWKFGGWSRRAALCRLSIRGLRLSCFLKQGKLLSSTY